MGIRVWAINLGIIANHESRLFEACPILLLTKGNNILDLNGH
jgi:hypothetical protein